MRLFRAIVVVLFSSLLLLSSQAADEQDTTVQNTDVLGSHDFSSSASPMHGPNANACSYCHIPHRGLSSTPLWNQQLSTQPYGLYTSGTAQNVQVQPAVGKTSTLCLSCHDGTVAVGQTVSYGKVTMTGAMTTSVGTKMESSHPFSLQLPLKDAAHLIPELTASQATRDSTKAVHLVDGNIECNTCHNVHNQRIDKHSPNFLARDNTAGALCLSCHETAPRTVNGVDNILAQWPTSVHAKSNAQVAIKAGMGEYANLSEIACGACHQTHNGVTGGLLKKSNAQTPTIDAASQSCLTCHDGSDNMVVPITNVLAEFQKTGHPFADANNQHMPGEPEVLDKNRHATCADCHQPHASAETTAFTSDSKLRPSQNGVSGVAADGTVLARATNQYESCLRCHGPGPEKKPIGNFGYLPSRTQFVGDQYDVSKQFALGALSSHAVIREAPEMKRPDLLDDISDIYFKKPIRPVTARLLCTDCHNADDNREFGGNGPNGVHGSQYDHILERRYVISKASAGPGSLIANVQQPPDLSYTSVSTYALCAKCHNMEYINSTASWPEHNRHIQDGFSCSVCHSAHGVPNGTTGVTGTGLVSFDMNVVAPNNGVVTWSGGVSCTLTCHEHPHSAQQPPPTGN